MADYAIRVNVEPKTTENRFSYSYPSPSIESMFSRRIEFHLARKPFPGTGNKWLIEILNPTAGSESQRNDMNIDTSKSALSLKKSDGSETFEIGLDLELSFSITKIGAGLENHGNTCFLNSVLQCLTYTEPLAAYLQTNMHKTSCRIAGFCALCAIQKHVSLALQSFGKRLAPNDLVSNLKCISRNFQVSRQQDAHEYMVNLLEAMHKCCLPLGVPSESPSAYERSFVHKIFGGRFQIQVKCTQCSYFSNTFDPFLNLSLEIAKAESLHKALMNFTAEEKLDAGERTYHCQQCKQKVGALKHVKVHKAPCVLIIHLKRFGSHDSGQKIDKKVHFDPTLDLKPFFSSSYEGDLKYTLYGVLVHDGPSIHSGHYHCFVRTSSLMWHSLDNDRVGLVGERKVFEQKAYMLFYVRDKRNIATKKSVDIVQKEILVANAMGRKSFPPSNQGLKETVPDVSLEERNSAVDTCAAKSQNICDAQTQTKIKKKIPKCWVASTPLSSSILFRTLLTSRKKKHERRKQSNLAVRDPAKENLEPSTSETSQTVSPVSTHSLRKRRIDTKEAIISSGNSGMHTIDEVSQKGDALATCEQPDKIPMMIQSFKTDEQPAKQRDERDYLFTSGLDKTIVKPWDGIELPLLQNIESSAAEGVSIGYIPDEWDEEYDRGKRKKVRHSRMSFGGSNPFQQFATQKAQMKSDCLQETALKKSRSESSWQRWNKKRQFIKS